MDRYFRKLHEHRAAPGFERTIWRSLPAALFGSIFLPVCLAVAIRLLPPDGTAHEVTKATKMVDFFAIGLGVTLLTAVLTVAIGCIVVMVMKGPAYVADGYAFESPDVPTASAGSKQPEPTLDG